MANSLLVIVSSWSTLSKCSYIYIFNKFSNTNFFTIFETAYYVQLMYNKNRVNNKLIGKLLINHNLPLK